jgi:integrase
MQAGKIIRKGNSWWVFYNVKEIRDGKACWAKRAKRLAPAGVEYRTVASVRHLAAEILAPLNTRLARPESSQTVISFIEDVYLPYCKANLRPSTHYGYKFIAGMLKRHLGSTKLREFGPMEGERVLADFATEKPRAQTMLKNVKGFLSGVFRYAVRNGVLQFNPMRETVLPKGGRPAKDEAAYTVKEIKAMLKVVPEPARTAILVAALTGLRRSEIRGLRWADFTGDELTVRTSVWGSHVGPTKTVASGATIPVVPMLRKALEAHHKTGTSEFIFVGGTGKPLVLPNVTRREIVPALKLAGIPWHGWHAFRRGVATTLYNLGVADKTIQRILRHANVAVTQRHYIMTNTEQAEAAMGKLGRAFAKKK